MSNRNRVGRCFWLIILLLMMFVCSGCFLQPSSNLNSLDNFRSVTDDTRTVVQIPDTPQHILSYGVSTDDILIALIGTERIVAVSELPPNWELEAEKIKGRVRRTTESVLSFKPDLVIMPDWVSADFIEQLRALQQTVYVYRTPRSIEERKVLIKQLGALLQEQKRAEAIIADMDRRLTEADKLFTSKEGIQKKTALYYTVNGGSGGADSSFNDLCNKANLVNVGALLGIKRGEHLSKESLLRVNPDIIFIPSHAYDKDAYKAPEVESLYQDEALQDIKAIKHRQVYVIDARWIMSYSQFMVNAVEAMATAAYGEKE